jgi:IclR family transcriptional regulator, acetate operon repressor
MAANETGTGGSANAAEKLLRTLDALPDNPRLADLARATELSKSTVHRLLRSMVDEGFASIDEVSGDYTPGPRLLALAGRTLHVVDTSIGAEPTLRRVLQETGATVHLAVRAGDEALYIRKMEGDKPYRMVSRVGMTIPLHCTGIGKAMLAGMSEEEVREVAARTGLVRRTPATITDADRLVAAVGEVAERGWATDDEENEVGIVCVGAGVRDHTGRVVAALSVSQLRTDPEAAPFDELGPIVAAAAKEISNAFGSPGS